MSIERIENVQKAIKEAEQEYLLLFKEYSKKNLQAIKLKRQLDTGLITLDVYLDSRLDSDMAYQKAIRAEWEVDELKREFKIENLKTKLTGD